MQSSEKPDIIGQAGGRKLTAFLHRRKEMIDGHIHIERGAYTLDWINQFVSKAVEMEIDEIRLMRIALKMWDIKSGN